VLTNTEGSTGQRRRNQGYDGIVNIGPAGVHADDLNTPLHAVRTVDGHLTVETSGTVQGSVQHVGAVSGSEHDHTGVAIEASNLREQDCIT
jgi:hypothetical protein